MRHGTITVVAIAKERRGAACHLLLCTAPTRPLHDLMVGAGMSALGLHACRTDEDTSDKVPRGCHVIEECNTPVLHALN